MHLLSEEELNMISGGVNNMSTHAAISALTGTVIGGGLGSVVAFSMAVPTITLFPIWLAACTGAGGAIGSLVGMAYSIGNNTCINCKPINK